MRMAALSHYRVFIDRRWSLEDLYVFPRAYEQVYFAYESLIEIEESSDKARIERAFEAFPWRGGYSAVNFYNQLKYATPKKMRPSITEMRYASPGYIELALNLPLAVQVAGSVTAIATSIGVCNKVYNQIYSDLQKRKLLRMEVEAKKIDLSVSQQKFVIETSERMAQLIGVESANEIHLRTKNPLISLKILLSIYRRMRKLAEMSNEGKIDLSKYLE